jgi:hypothetical protein
MVCLNIVKQRFDCRGRCHVIRRVLYVPLRKYSNADDELPSTPIQGSYIPGVQPIHMVTDIYCPHISYGVEYTEENADWKSIARSYDSV